MQKRGAARKAKQTSVQYFPLLRDAAVLAQAATRVSPATKKQKSEAGSSSLVRNLSSDEDEPAETDVAGTDVVLDEVERWKKSRQGNDSRVS